MNSLNYNKNIVPYMLMELDINENEYKFSSDIKTALDNAELQI